MKKSNNKNKARKNHIRLTMEQKVEILRFKESNKDKSNVWIAEYFSQKFKSTISRRSISNYATNEKLIMENYKTNPEFKQSRPLVFKNIDDKVNTFCDKIESEGGFLTDEVILKRAEKYAAELKNLDFKASRGWLDRFKRRNSMKQRNFHGETYSKDPVNFSDYLSEIKILVNQYGESNVFNMDETGLFYKIIPSKSICKNSRKGYKNFKDRVSIMLCSNMDGSEKLKPLIIGKSKKPRCFASFKMLDSITYCNSKKAWMTSSIYTDWLMNWNRRLKSKNRKILLILDNCPAHKCIEVLSNIEIKFLPKNSTGNLQPMDLGIIRSFKSKFEKLKLEKIIDSVIRGNNVYKCYNSIDLKDVIIFTDMAWSEMSKNTIANCFKHFVEDKGDINLTTSDISQNTKFIESYITKLDIFDGISVDDYLDVSYTENDEIIEYLEGAGETESGTYEINQTSSKTIGKDEAPTKNEALKSIDCLIRYYRDKEMSDNEFRLLKILINEERNLKKLGENTTLLDLGFVKK